MFVVDVVTLNYVDVNFECIFQVRNNYQHSMTVLFTDYSDGLIPLFDSSRWCASYIESYASITIFLPG